MRIYVGNLSYGTTDSSLVEAFGQHGTVSSAEVVKDRETGQNRGFGFVEMPDSAEAQKAITALDSSDLDGRQIAVSEAKARGESRGGGGQRGSTGGGRRY